MGGVPIILRGAEGALFIHKNTDKSYDPLPPRFTRGRRCFYYSQNTHTQHILRGAEGASTVRKSIDTRRVRKLVKPSEKVARRRRKICRISVSEIYFVKELKHENSPPQAEIF